MGDSVGANGADGTEDGEALGINVGLPGTKLGATVGVTLGANEVGLCVGKSVENMQAPVDAT